MIYTRASCPFMSNIFTAFCAIVQLARATRNLLAIEVIEQGFVEKKTRLNKPRLGRVSIQTALCVTFLQNYSRRYELACPTGRGSRKDEQIRYIDINTSRRMCVTSTWRNGQKCYIMCSQPRLLLSNILPNRCDFDLF